MDAITSFFSTWWDSFITFSSSVLIWVCDSLILVVGYLLYYVFDGLLWSCYSIVSAINFGAQSFDFVGNLLGLPGPLLYLLHQCGFGESLTIICSGILVRMALNLIPAAVTRI